MLQALLHVPLVKVNIGVPNCPQVPFSETIQSNPLLIDRDRGINTSGNIPFCFSLLDLELASCSSAESALRHELQRLLIWATASMDQSQILENMKMAYWWAGYYSALYDAKQSTTQPRKE